MFNKIQKKSSQKNGLKSRSLTFYFFKFNFNQQGIDRQQFLDWKLFI